MVLLGTWRMWCVCMCCTCGKRNMWTCINSTPVPKPQRMMKVLLMFQDDRNSANWKLEENMCKKANVIALLCCRKKKRFFMYWWSSWTLKTCTNHEQKHCEIKEIWPTDFTKHSILTSTNTAIPQASRAMSSCGYNMSAYSDVHWQCHMQSYWNTTTLTMFG